MTKKQLLKKLEKIPDSAQIVLSSDSEGNVYSYLSDVSYEPGLKATDEIEKEYSYGLVLVEKDDINDEEFGISAAQYKRAKNCVIFYP